jgi:hypothetical protein
MQSLNKLKKAINEKFNPNKGFPDLFTAFKWNLENDPKAQSPAGRELFRELKSRMQDI